MNSLELIKNISNQNIQDKINTIEINITSSFDVIISNIQTLIGSNQFNESISKINKLKIDIEHLKIYNKYNELKIKFNNLQNY